MRRPSSLILALFLCLPSCGDDTSTGSGTADGSSGSSGSSGPGATNSPPTTADTTVGSMSQSGTGSSGDPTTSMGSSTTVDPDSGDSGSSDSGSTTGPMGGCPGLGNAGLLYHSTLDDAASVTLPAVGLPGMTITTPMNDFVAGLDGGAVQIDAPGELVRVPQGDNIGTATIDPREGTVDFCYQPNFNHTDGGEHGLFGTSDEGQGWVRARVSGSNADSIHLFAFVPGPGMNFVEVQAFGTDYVMNAGEWYRLTLSWDFVNQPDPDLHIYLDGVELPLSVDNTAGNPLMMPAPNPLGFLEIGAIIREPQNNDWAADGVIDDFKVYDSALVP